MFSLVWPHLEKYLLEARTEAEVAATFALERAQARAWLLRATAEGKVAKLKQPARFQAIASRDTRRDLFD
jgi:hypothetical protein